MNNSIVYGYDMAKISEVYLSTLSSMMAEYGLDRYFFPLVYLCENSGETTQQAMAIALRKDKVSTMRTVDYLHQKGFVKRVSDKDDKRCNKLFVTSKALEILPKIKDSVQKTNALLFSDLSNDEKQVFANCMQKLNATINTLPEPDFIVKAHKRKK